MGRKENLKFDMFQVYTPGTSRGIFSNMKEEAIEKIKEEKQIEMLLKQIYCEVKEVNLSLKELELKIDLLNVRISSNSNELESTFNNEDKVGGGTSEKDNRKAKEIKELLNKILKNLGGV